MRRGFTLIELLVVIAIISILAAILFPVFAQAKNAAKAVVCMSNMKQIALAGQMYMNDNDDVWFPAEMYDPLPGFPPQHPWIGFDNSNVAFNGFFYGDTSKPAIAPFRPGIIDLYIKNDAIKKCPNQPQTSQTSLALSGFNSFTTSAYYAVNPAANGNEYGPSMYNPQLTPGGMSYQGVPSTSVERDAETLMAWEHLSYAPQCNFIQPYNWLDSPPNNQALIDHFHFLHTNATNTIWCDGHAKRWTYFALKRPMFSVRKDIYPGN